MRFGSTLTLLTLVTTVALAGTNMKESIDILPDEKNNTLSITPNDGSSPYTIIVNSSTDSAPNPITIYADVYLWWIARDPFGSFVQSYTSFPSDTVSLRVYDAFGNTIRQSPRTDSTEQRYNFVFKFDHDQPTPIVLLFDLDATIETATYDGTPISDTFVPTVMWIAGNLADGGATTLSVAIPTVGQLYAIGGSAIIDKQLALMSTVLANTPAGSTLLSRIRTRVASVLDDYINRDLKVWPTFIDCVDCPRMVVIPSGDLSTKWSEQQSNQVVSLQSFAMGVDEISIGEFARFISDTGHAVNQSCFSSDPEQGRKWTKTDLDWSTLSDSSEADPVRCISWDDARSYVNWLSNRAGKQYRLLTLAESLYASERYLSDAPETEIFGLLDHGRQSDLEWVQDCWSGTIPELSEDGRARDRAECDQRTAVRVDPGLTYYGLSFPPEYSGNIISFRVGRDLRQTDGYR